MARLELDAANGAKPYNVDTIRHAFHKWVVSVENNGQDIRAFCPLCEDPEASNSPSATFTPSKGLFACKSGKCPSKGGMRISKLVAYLKEETGWDIRAERIRGRNAELGHPTKQRKEQKAAATEEEVSAWHSALLRNKTAHKELMDKRGFSKETIRAWDIGWDGERYLIPVRVDGVVVNVRKYKMNASAAQDKMRNTPGFGTGRLFAVSFLERNSTIVLTEGETDCILLNQYGIPAVTHTAGAATFKNEWGPEFKGKTVYICYDNDESGSSGALKAARAIDPFAEAVYIIQIPLPQKGSDITNYLWDEGHTAADFRKLMETAKPARPGKHTLTADAPVKGESVTLQESMNPEHGTGTLELRVTVAGKNNPPYSVPRRFTANCSTDKGPRYCSLCPMQAREGEMKVEYQPNDPDLFKFLDVTEEKLPKAMKDAVRARCMDRIEFTIEERYSIEELVLANPVDQMATDSTMTPLTRTVYSVGSYKTEANSIVRMVGRNIPSPKDQRLSFMGWINEAVRTSLDDFEVTPERMDLLRVFRDPNKSPLERCLDIAGSMSEEVTRIYGQNLLHVVYDLVWHSPLSFFAGKDYLHKGWLEAMVVGDTRTGKSEIAIKLAQHYRAGIIKGCEGATFAGLVGGVQQMGKSWMTTWGVIPLNDRRLVVLDEVSGLSTSEANIIEKMSYIRSAGIAQMVKIQAEETPARTRLIWITNPKDGSMLRDKPGVGIDAMRTVVQANEDIARFDFVAAVQQGSVSIEDIVRPRPVRRPTFSQEECATLVLWAWSLQPHNIHFTPAAIRAAEKLSKDIAKEYLADPPLLQGENCRYKLYRIAAALAARTFSIRAETEDDCDLLVAEDHIYDAKRFLDLLYSSPAMPYREMSQRRLHRQNLAHKNKATCMQYLDENPEILQVLLAINGTTFRPADFCDYSGMSRQQANQIVGMLWKMGMVERGEKGVVTMHPVLFDLVREMEG